MRWVARERAQLANAEETNSMNYKCIAALGLMLVLAAPAVAEPTVHVVKGGTTSSGHLDSNGNWVWRVQIAPTNPLPDFQGVHLAAELGFRVRGAELLGATLSPGSLFNTPKPGQPIFGWETPTSPPDGEILPEGLQVNLETNEIFASFSSAKIVDIFRASFIEIVTKGPSSGAGGSLTTTIEWLGAYEGRGRITEIDPGEPPTETHYDIYAGAVIRTAMPGDADLDGQVFLSDLKYPLNNLGRRTSRWIDGNFNNAEDDIVFLSDFNDVLNGFGTNYNVGPTPVTAPLATEIPEPASALLIALAALLVPIVRCSGPNRGEAIYCFWPRSVLMYTSVCGPNLTRKNCLSSLKWPLV
jgi:hypothetical protein